MRADFTALREELDRDRNAFVQDAIGGEGMEHLAELQAERDKRLGKKSRKAKSIEQTRAKKNQHEFDLEIAGSSASTETVDQAPADSGGTAAEAEPGSGSSGERGTRRSGRGRSNAAATAEPAPAPSIQSVPDIKPPADSPAPAPAAEPRRVIPLYPRRPDFGVRLVDPSLNPRQAQ